MFNIKPKIINSQDLINISEKIPNNLKKVNKKPLKEKKKDLKEVIAIDKNIDTEKKIKTQYYSGIDIPWLF